MLNFFDNRFFSVTTVIFQTTVGECYREFQKEIIRCGDSIILYKNMNS